MIKKRVRNLWKMDSIKAEPKKLFCWTFAGDSQCVISQTVEDAFNRLTNNFIKRNSQIDSGVQLEIKDGVISFNCVDWDSLE